MTVFMSYTKKAAAFEKLVGICAGYEGKYNPARQNLNSNALRLLAGQAVEAERAVADARRRFATAAGQRDEAFKSLGVVLKRLRAEIQLLSVDAGTRKLLVDVTNKASTFYPGSARPVPVEKEAPKAKRSYSGKDAATRLAAFGDLVDALEGVTDYHPSTEDLSVVALRAQAAGLKAHIQAVIEAGSALNMVRNERRRIFTDPETGVLAIARDVRNTFKSIFGSPSAELTGVRMIRFI